MNSKFRRIPIQPFQLFIQAVLLSYLLDLPNRSSQRRGSDRLLLRRFMLSHKLVQQLVLIFLCQCLDLSYEGSLFNSAQFFLFFPELLKLFNHPFLSDNPGIPTVIVCRRARVERACSHGKHIADKGQIFKQRILRDRFDLKPEKAVISLLFTVGQINEDLLARELFGADGGIIPQNGRQISSFIFRFLPPFLEPGYYPAHDGANLIGARIGIGKIKISVQKNIIACHGVKDFKNLLPDFRLRGHKNREAPFLGRQPHARHGTFHGREFAYVVRIIGIKSR